jgi:beta-fructofuranosidase
MTINLPDKWVWDFWFAQDGPDTHIFYLQAPRNLQKERLRHWHVSIGHAVSDDLIHWEILPDALAPSKGPGSWDDYTTWTGSILQHNGTWFLFYTGSSRAEKGLVQRVGLATSENLIQWQRHPENPLIEADPSWYELLDLDLWHDQAWRDPWIFQYEERFHAFITARVNYGDADARGVIGHATSTDLLNWDVRPPITEPGEFGQMEVPQLVQMGGRWYLFFSTSRNKHAQTRIMRPDIQAQTGTHYLVGDHPLGPFDYLTDQFLVGDKVGSLYSGKVIQDRRGDWVLMAFKLFGSQNQFIGQITDPISLSVSPEGILTLATDDQ